MNLRAKRCLLNCMTAFFLGGILITSSQVLAQPNSSLNYNPGRPGFGCGSNTLITNTLSVETSFIGSGDPSLPWSQGGNLTNGYTLRISPVNGFELALGTGWTKDAGSKLSLSGTSLFTRINIIRKKGYLPGFAVAGGLSFPFGHKNNPAVSQGVNPMVTLILDHNIGDWWIAYNVGTNWAVKSQSTELFYCVSAGTSVVESGRFNLYGEFIGSNEWYYRESDQNLAQATGSYIFRLGGDIFITPNLKFDFTVGTSLTRARYLEGEIGLAYGIPLKRQKTDPEN